MRHISKEASLFSASAGAVCETGYVHTQFYILHVIYFSYFVIPLERPTGFLISLLLAAEELS